MDRKINKEGTDTKDHGGVWGGVKREGRGRKKEKVTDSKGEQPVLVSCASTAEVMQ